MSSLPLRAALATALALALATHAWGEIYEWTDAAGTKQFTSDLAKVPASQREAAMARARAKHRAPPAAQAPPAAAATKPATGARVPGLMRSRLSPGAFAAWRDNLASTPRPDGPAIGGVWAVLMETGFERGASTLLVRSDGATDLLLSAGGGLTWGGDVPAVNERARRLVAQAAREIAKLPPVAVTPLPRDGEVRFYALTDGGIRGASAPRAALGSGKHPLSPLFLASHEVITALREAAEAEGLSL